jgi:predicted phage baseplate assembly protein
MPLPLPKLDKLTYDELVSDARSNLPALAPGWTDYNAHDPGITQIELLAWLTEINSYRLGVIPEQAYRAYLRLVGIVPNPAQVAETALVFACEIAAQQVLAGTVVPIRDTGIHFQTSKPLTISTAKLQAVLSGGAQKIDNTEQNSPDKGGYYAFGAESESDAALYLGFDQTLAAEGAELSLGIWTGHEADDQLTRARLEEEQNELNQERRSLCKHHEAVSALDWRLHYSVRTVWEYYAGEEHWLPLQDVEDDTRALSLSGTIRFKAPAITRHQIGGIAHLNFQQLYFIRCRIVRGKYDCPPRIAYVALNTVIGRHAINVEQQTFTSNGRAGQVFTLAQKPVVPKSANVSIQNDNQPWQEILFWDGYGPHDRVYLLEPETGMIRFGDGRVGRVPSADAEITVQYQVGGGAAGNVAAKAVTEPVEESQNRKVFQPFTAVGGADAETLNQTKARAVKTLATPTRTITLQDMEWLAQNIPGLPVAKAYAIADYHPFLQCIPVNGSNTVVILPPCPEQKPIPGRELCQAVQAYLQRRRVLTGELYVIAPHYVTVAIHVRLIRQPQTDSAGLITLAKRTLADYFNPLHGGPEQQGWPVGRSIYRSELLAMLNALPGVVYVDSLCWSVDDKPTSRCGNITLCRHALVASGNHQITIQTGSRQ